MPPVGPARTAPEWFYKGRRKIMRGHLETRFLFPDYGEDGGEEPEIAGVYVISADGGSQVRVGFTQGNEFSDHKLERRNYYLARSRTPERAHWVPNSSWWTPNSRMHTGA